MINTLKELCSLYGGSGRECSVREYIMSRIPEDAEKTVDARGNLLVFKKGKNRPHNKVMLCAHMDEVGMIITYITEKGFLKFSCVGGINVSALIGKRVVVGEQKISGVIGVKPTHLLSDEEEKIYPSKDSLYIDIGAESKSEAEKYVSLGDYAYFDSDFVQFGEGFIKGRAIDDRAGCAIMLEMLKEELLYDTWFAFTVQEETGTSGATNAAFTIKPDISIVLEATTASDINGVSGEKKVCSIDGGAVVSMMDRGTIYPKELYSKAFEEAEKNGIKAQTKTVIAGGNDARVISASAGGVKVLAVSVPCRYLHSPSCVIGESDLTECYRLASLMCGVFSDD